MQKRKLPVWHSIIIGGGASGLFCAGSYPAPKLLLEHNACAGRKLNITGGGKCNFTNLHSAENAYIGAKKHFCHPALAAFRPSCFTALLEEEKIPYREKEDGQLFAQDARQVTAMLLRRAEQNNTDILCRTEVLRAGRERDVFRVETSRGVFYAHNLIIASGGLSYPQLGASGFAWRAAQEFGLKTAPPRPALVSLALPEPWRSICRSLAGSSLSAQITCGKKRERGMLLFTHEGISGPAVLQISLYWKEEMPLSLDFLPDTDAAAYLQQHKNRPELFSGILSPFIRPKITKVWLGNLDVRASDAKKEILHAAAQRLNACTVTPCATRGFARAEVTAGGVETDQLYPASMECKMVRRLFVIGEAVNVTGRLGGFNLHWAWVSAYAAAHALAQR